MPGTWPTLVARKVQQSFNTEGPMRILTRVLSSSEKKYHPMMDRGRDMEREKTSSRLPSKCRWNDVFVIATRPLKVAAITFKTFSESLPVVG
jgi:hypothetical protein